MNRYLRNFYATLMAICYCSIAHGNEALLDAFQFTKPEACTSVRLDQGTGVLARLPVLDQQRGLICHSYVASQLVDSWNLKNDPTQPLITSPIALAVKDARMVGRQNLAISASAIDILDRVRHIPLCSFSKVPDRLNDRSTFDFISEIVRAYQERDKNSDGKILVARINQTLRSFGVDRTFSPVEPMKYLDTPSWIPLVDDVLDVVCGGRHMVAPRFPATKASRVYVARTVAIGIANNQARLHERLSRVNPLPVGITFCPNVFKDRDISSLNASGRLDPAKCVGVPDINGGLSLHTAIVVGRRLVKFKDTDGKEYPFCQFLIRDSYGTSCSKYPDDPEITPSRVCENGQIWVDESALLTNTSEVFYLNDN
jgi:hypothetical protein